MPAADVHGAVTSRLVTGQCDPTGAGVFAYQSFRLTNSRVVCIGVGMLDLGAILGQRGQLRGSPHITCSSQAAGGPRQENDPCTGSGGASAHRSQGVTSVAAHAANAQARPGVGGVCGHHPELPAVPGLRATSAP